LRSVAFFTLGCKINLLESEVMQEDLKSRGYRLTDDYYHADIVVINSCTVTEKADRKFKDFIKRVKKNNPLAIIAAAGCFTELNPEKTAALGGIDLILGSEKLSLPEELERITVKTGQPLILTDKDLTVFEDYRIDHFGSHTRAFLKIQDGCNNFCTYCTIPQARGRSRSRKLEHVLADTEKLAGSGYHEIVLSGIDLGSYRDTGSDGTDITLAGVMRAMLKIPGFRIRIGSLEPWCINDDLVELILTEERICPHLHIPLQAGSDTILKRMNRKYRTADFSELLQRLNSRPDMMLATDIIVGFPGESNEEFTESCRFLTDSPLAYAHVFSYSDRPHAAATKLPDKVPKNIIKERSEILRNISEQKKKSFYQNQPGKSFSVLLEECKHGFWRGYTENYLPVKLSADADLKKGDLVKVKITKLDGDWLFALKA